MPLNHARLRAVDAFTALREAQTAAGPGTFRVELICNALQAVRDLLVVYGDHFETTPEQKAGVAALEFLAHDIPTLILALEVTAVRAETLLKIQDTVSGAGGQ
jgi:hypothetical protein